MRTNEENLGCLKKIGDLSRKKTGVLMMNTTVFNAEDVDFFDERPDLISTELI